MDSHRFTRMSIQARAAYAKAAFAACLWAAGACAATAADDFRWSWEKGGGGAAPSAAGTGGTVFAWGWQTSGAARATAPAAPEPVPAVKPVETRPGPGSVDASAYNELLRDNLDLRRKLTDAGGAEARLARENQRLSGEVKGLEEQIAKLVLSIQELKSKEPGGTGAKELESKLAQVEAEKNRLRESLATLTREAEERKRSPENLSPPPQPAVSSVERGSDLFRRLEKENLELRQNLARLEVENAAATNRQAKIASEEAKARDAVASLSDREQELRRELAVAKERAERGRDVMERLPKIEGELASLNEDVKTKAAALAEKDRQIESLREELKRRETRVSTAERSAAILNQARRETQVAVEREKRDMYYNMGVMYARDGNYRSAEKEYLKALQIDPADPDLHYNLGILYDESLGDKAKAAVHYRRFLMLKPHGPDAEDVKGWLMAIEVRR